MITRKTVKVELAFKGTGAVVEARPGQFIGGVPEPELAGAVSFHVWREARDFAGVWNPLPGEGPFDGGLQVSVTGTSEGYRRLGQYLLSLAELDTSIDPGFHQHAGLTSADGGTHLHLVLRKRD